MRLELIFFCILFGIGLIGITQHRKFPTFFDSSKEFGVFWVEPSSIHWFMWTGHACGGRHDSWITGYEAYNGSRLSKSGEYYSSSSEAEHVLQKDLTGALRVIENSAKFNGRKKRIGQRVVALFPANEDKEVAVILWTDKESLYRIEATSLEIALEFEKSRIE